MKHTKLRLRDSSQRTLRFWERIKSFRDSQFSRYHLAPLAFSQAKHLDSYLLVEDFIYSYKKNNKITTVLKLTVVNQWTTLVLYISLSPCCWSLFSIQNSLSDDFLRTLMNQTSNCYSFANNLNFDRKIFPVPTVQFGLFYSFFVENVSRRAVISCAFCYQVSLGKNLIWLL